MAQDDDALGGAMGFELLAASLRADAGDTRAFVEALARKLEDALPRRVHIDRHSSLFSHEHPVQRIQAQLGEWEYELICGPGSALDARRTHLVRGVALKSEQIDLDEWIDTLSAELAELAQHSAQDHEALRRLLG
ncbi:MAG TPA: hypothetical protein VGS80_11610 [Ktedonobacterales bacterium]|nr:hypothetical protein [Ktedonobacterales bacterium]